MILIEGDKFCIGTKECELDDFYMAEIPVTQELYMAVMGPAHTGSYNMMPDNFDYLHRTLYSVPMGRMVHNETLEEYEKRLDCEWRAKSARESEERNRIEELAKSLPVNNISWLECIEFINRLNTLTGLNFVLPSFEQWYFAACGGIESKGYKFSGSDDANEVGHFSKLSKKEFTQGVYVMTGESKPTVRKPASCWYEKPKHYKPNELGIYDMSGLIYEWLDTPGKVIGGSFNTEPDRVTRSQNFGYTDYKFADHVYFYPKPSKYTGFRLALSNNKKQYDIPQVPRVISDVSENERKLIDILSNTAEIGVLRSIIANKYVKEATIRCREENIEFSRFLGNIYNVFICPQNLNGFAGQCFENYLSRRKFVNHCKEIFTNLLFSLIEQGYELLIHDELGLNLTDNPKFVMVDSAFMSFKGSFLRHKETLNELFTTMNFISTSKEITHSTIWVDIKDTKSIFRYEEENSSWIYSVGNTIKPKKKNIRLSLSCFCDFRSDDNDFVGSQYSDGLQSVTYKSMGIVRFMRENIVKHGQRVHNEDFDNSMRVNRLFCKQNKGGLYEYNYPESSGIYAIQDERFYILPQLVYDEWRKTLK